MAMTLNLRSSAHFLLVLTLTFGILPSPLARGAELPIRKLQSIDKGKEITLLEFLEGTIKPKVSTEEDQNVFKQFSPDFFDLIVIDECHRSSAREASRWHEILTYFEGIGT